MGWWEINADTLARGRFVVSPLDETLACLKMLHAGVAGHPGERAWLDTHRPAHLRRMAADPVTALLVASGLGREWNADFLTPTPVEGQSFADGVARISTVTPRTEVQASSNPSALTRTRAPWERSSRADASATTTARRSWGQWSCTTRPSGWSACPYRSPRRSISATRPTSEAARSRLMLRNPGPVRTTSVIPSVPTR